MGYPKISCMSQLVSQKNKSQMHIQVSNIQFADSNNRVILLLFSYLDISECHAYKLMFKYIFLSVMVTFPVFNLKATYVCFFLFRN